MTKIKSSELFEVNCKNKLLKRSSELFDRNAKIFKEQCKLEGKVLYTKSINQSRILL